MHLRSLWFILRINLPQISLVCLLVYIQLYWPADRAHRIQWCPIKNALRLLIELIPKAGPGTINALEKQTELHSESTKASRNQRETSHRSIYTNLMNTLKPAALHLAAGQRLLGVFHSSSEGKKGQKWWELMQNDSWHVWQCNEKKLILKCKKHKKQAQKK